MLIERKPEYRDRLRGKTVLLTGGGGGIGLETAKALAYLGARVFLAELDEERGKLAQREVAALQCGGTAEFYRVDLGDEADVRRMAAAFGERYGCPDVLFHNAALAVTGRVEEVPLAAWERSYRVNFRAPLLLTQLFLPEMRRRDAGCIVFVPSSGAAPYLGAYEVYKTAQVELSNTLAGELEGAGVHTFSIGPGLVRTRTAAEAIRSVAEQMGMTTEEFYRMNGSHILSAEEAGCGFAVSLLRAAEYNGQEIGSIQALLDAGLMEGPGEGAASAAPAGEMLAAALRAARIYEEQYRGWLERNVFERQWVLRDFKKTTGIPADRFRQDMERLRRELEQGETGSLNGSRGHFAKLNAYYARQYKLLQGFEKDPAKLRENSAVLMEWMQETGRLAEEL